MMRYLYTRGINCPQIIPNIEGKDYSIEKLIIEKEDIPNRDKFGLYLIRMFNFIPGETLNDVTVTPDLCYQAGKYIGKIDNYLLKFHHKGLEGHMTIWSLGSVPKLVEFAPKIRDVNRKILANAIIERFSQLVTPHLSEFKKGVIHGDFNEHNIVVTKDSNDEHKIYGVIDFGDVHISYYIFEIALCITYMMIKVEDSEVFSCGGHVLAGYLEEMSLSYEELNCLQLCICARLCQSLTMGEYTYSLDPGNEYLLSSAKRGWKVLDKIWEVDKEPLYNLWDEIIVERQNDKMKKEGKCTEI
ncbi:unnamed protein product [Gordionus sp. m RMFG-2023]